MGFGFYVYPPRSILNGLWGSIYTHLVSQPTAYPWIKDKFSSKSLSLPPNPSSSPPPPPQTPFHTPPVLRSRHRSFTLSSLHSTCRSLFFFSNPPIRLTQGRYFFHFSFLLLLLLFILFLCFLIFSFSYSSPQLSLTLVSPPEHQRLSNPGNLLFLNFWIVFPHKLEDGY